MQSITSEWLHERGGLHDATVTDININGSVLEISFDDEWVNERSLTKPEGQTSPGTLTAHLLVAEGQPTVAKRGWISEVSLNGRTLNLEFCDRPALRFEIGSAWWRAG